MAESIDIRALNAEIEAQSAFVTSLKAGMNQVIVGQTHLVESLLIGLLSNGHVLLEGVPGLAKTLAIKTLANLVSGQFSRVQFTPDLLPADVIGTMIYSQTEGKFIANRGPIFANFVLADEINRAPAKVQSALLEAMQERQVTLGKETFNLPKPFLVLATQNPVEQEGTYTLPEAQMDRFMLKVLTATSRRFLQSFLPTRFLRLARLLRRFISTRRFRNILQILSLQPDSLRSMAWRISRTSSHSVVLLVLQSACALLQEHTHSSSVVAT